MLTLVNQADHIFLFDPSHRVYSPVLLSLLFIEINILADELVTKVCSQEVIEEVSTAPQRLICLLNLLIWLGFYLLALLSFLLKILLALKFDELGIEVKLAFAVVGLF